MRISVLIFISLAANIILAALLLRPGQGGAAMLSGDMAGNNSSGVAGDNSPAVENENSMAAAGAKISWRDLQAAELKEFVRKLRAVNCPEETIKDLVLADLNQRYSKQQRAIWSDQQNQ